MSIIQRIKSMCIGAGQPPAQIAAPAVPAPPQLSAQAANILAQQNANQWSQGIAGQLAGAQNQLNNQWAYAQQGDLANQAAVGGLNWPPAPTWEDNVPDDESMQLFSLKPTTNLRQSMSRNINQPFPMPVKLAHLQRCMFDV